jgi:hypothetical protein
MSDFSFELNLQLFSSEKKKYNNILF